MSEHFPATPGQLDPTAAEAELLLQQQNTIRSLAEGRINDTPMEPGVRADWKAGKFGLEAGKYDVFEDKEAPFAGGFTKLVSKEDAADTLVGISWPHIGGNMSDPTRYIYNVALKPNGDIVGRYSAENGDKPEPEFYDYDLPANSPDPEIANRYKRTLKMLHDKAQEAMNLSDIAPRGGSMSAPETRQQHKQGRLSRWLGRSSLR